jgi:ADP-ribose pyrophosphatase YjhB (NUDIX family)
MFDFFSRSKKVRIRVAALIRNSEGKVLLIKQRKKGKDYWLLPGGGLEFGESLEDALKRELKEELNVEIINSKFLLISESIDPLGARHIVQIIFETEIQEQKIEIPKSEKSVIDVSYFSLEELLKLEVRPDIKEYFLDGKKHIKSIWIEE